LAAFIVVSQHALALLAQIDMRSAPKLLAGIP